MIEHYYQGRRVVTITEAAALRDIAPKSMAKDVVRRRLAGKVTELPKIDGRTPVFYPEDLGLETPR